MKSDIVVTVQARDTDAFATKVNAIQIIAARAFSESDEEIEPVDDESPEPSTPPTEPQPAYFVIGKGSATPGEVAEVEVLGTTWRKVSGLGAYVGCHKDLNLTGVVATDELKLLVNSEEPHVMASQGRYGGLGDYISVMSIFFGSLEKESEQFEPDDPPPAISRTLVEVIIPELTPLMVLSFKVPPDAASGRRFHLDNTPWKYGRRMSNGRGGWWRMGMPASYAVTSGGREIRPVCISGWVDVL